MAIQKGVSMWSRTTAEVETEMYFFLYCEKYFQITQSFSNKYLKPDVPVTRSIRKWSDDADATLQNCFASTDWNMFRDSSNGIGV